MDVCQKCRKPIHWIKTEAGKNHPIDKDVIPGFAFEPGMVTPDKGRKLWVVVKGTMKLLTVYDENIGNQGRPVQAFISHFATCPDRKYFKKPKKSDNILCNYKGEPREIHPAVCEWHREENNPECTGCERGKDER